MMIEISAAWVAIILTSVTMMATGAGFFLNRIGRGDSKLHERIDSIQREADKKYVSKREINGSLQNITRLIDTHNRSVMTELKSMRNEQDTMRGTITATATTVSHLQGMFEGLTTKEANVPKTSKAG